MVIMKYYMQINNKAKAALLLFGMMVLLLLHHISGRKHFSDVNASVASIYNDRLVPATYLFHISEHLYENRLLIEEKPGDIQGLQERLVAHDQEIVRLMTNL